jgi:hypothetical protein
MTPMDQKVVPMPRHAPVATVQPPVGPRVHVDHLSMPFEAEDFVAGRRLAWDLGSLELDKERDAPDVQWRTVVRALRLHGMKIVVDIRPR